MDEAGRHPHDPDGTDCPKRVWVMTSLSDDEATGDAGGLSQGLRLHLAQCKSCRALADRLMTTTGTLRSLSMLEPDDKLVNRATEQALQALREGGKFTGRVSIPDDPEPDQTIPGAAVWSRYVRYALAASVFLAFGLCGLWVLRQPQRFQVAQVAIPAAADDAAPAVEAASSILSGKGSGAVAETTERLAATGDEELPDAGSSRAGWSRQTPRYRSHVEAALCDDTHYVHRAVILPGRRSSGPGAGREIGRLLSVFEGFDSSRPSGSTERRPNGG